jgi:hypothetical protein
VPHRLPDNGFNVEILFQEPVFVAQRSAQAAAASRS